MMLSMSCASLLWAMSVRRVLHDFTFCADQPAIMFCRLVLSEHVYALMPLGSSETAGARNGECHFTQNSIPSFPGNTCNRNGPSEVVVSTGTPPPPEQESVRLNS
jgi:hypothetical protein